MSKPARSSGLDAWQMDPQQMRMAVTHMAGLIQARMGAVPLIIGIGAGGERPARYIATELGTPLVIITRRGRPSPACSGTARAGIPWDLAALHGFRQGRLLDGPILLVDDICRTGSTLDGARTMVARWATAEADIRTAVLYRLTAVQPGVPDIHVWDVADLAAPLPMTPCGRD